MPGNAAARPADCNCFAIRSAARHVSQLYDQILAPTGLRTTQFSILAHLKEGPRTINALAQKMDRTTLGRNILPLERDGLLATASAPSDRRAKVLRLTKAGEDRLRAARICWTDAQARFEATFGAKRAANLRSLLRAVLATRCDAT
jgi:DNA-binding MarR family transcriptional regulator